MTKLNESDKLTVGSTILYFIIKIIDFIVHNLLALCVWLSMGFVSHSKYQHWCRICHRCFHRCCAKYFITYRVLLPSQDGNAMHEVKKRLGSHTPSGADSGVNSHKRVKVLHY